MFNVWKEVWWSGRREWKLVIRADCHNRYSLTLGVAYTGFDQCLDQVSAVAGCMEGVVCVC